MCTYVYICIHIYIYTDVVCNYPQVSNSGPEITNRSAKDSLHLACSDMLRLPQCDGTE